MKSLLFKLGVSLVAVVLIVFGYSEVSGEEKYLCVPDRATGFKYNESSGRWEQASFKTDHKYIISKSDDKKYTFIVTQIRDNYTISYCVQGFNEFGYLFCSGRGEFKFNKNNGRFIYAYSFGYFNVLPNSPFIPTDEKSPAPFIEIGKCSPF